MTSKSKALTGLGRGDIGAQTHKKKLISKKPKVEPNVDTDQFLVPPKGFPIDKAMKKAEKGGNKSHHCSRTGREIEAIPPCTEIRK